MELAVTGIGMATPLGLDAVTSCAAARAGLQRANPSPTFTAIVEDDAPPPEVLPISVHSVPVVAHGFFGYARNLQIASAALTDLIASDGWQENPRTGIILLTSNSGYRRAFANSVREEEKIEANSGSESDGELAEYEAFLEQTDDWFRNKLLAEVLRRVPVQTESVTRLTIAATATGLGAVLEQARTWFKSNLCDRCIVGEVDSLSDPLVLEALDGLGLIKTPKRPAALSPGEASTFMTVLPLADAQKAGTKILAILGQVGIGAGPAHPALRDNDSTREGLSDLASMVAGGMAQPNLLLVANLNGDDHRANAFSQIFYQSKDERLRNASYWLPALAFGDTGAACGLTSVALLAQGWQRNYAPAQDALVCLLDDFGGRMILGLRAP